MPPKKNNPDFKSLGEQLKAIAAQREAIMKQQQQQKQLTFEQEINQAIREGGKLLEEEAKKSKETPKTEEGPKVNPYFAARLIVLKKMPQWKKSEIAEMEKTGNIHNKYYDDFVKEVAREGDKLSS